MTWRRDFLEARDRRQQELDRIQRQCFHEGAASVVLIAANVPGPDKLRPGISCLLRTALDSIQESAGLTVLLTGRDLLGAFYIASSPRPPDTVKQAAIALETANPSARLLDVDVYRPDGSSLHRTSFGLPPRSCLVCSEPACDCIRLGRHSQAELLNRVDALLQPFAPLPSRIDPETLAANLPLGALHELDLTPKPGLVDRRDSGSHPDLSYAAMRASVDLLPFYFEQILACHRRQRPLADFVQAGIDAENRMNREIRSNTHKGYIFLSGLMLMAACACDGQTGLLRQTTAKIAGDFFVHFGSNHSHGACIRDRHQLGGIRTEAGRGLPAVLEHGWPRYRETLAAGWSRERASFYLMAVLMQQVEDTTAIHRCGLDGLHRLRSDGARLQRQLEKQQEPEPMLAALNREYREMGMTMGGVADCMALTFALEETAAQLGNRSTP